VFRGVTSTHLPFNTAVLYDLENLLGGYSFNARLVADLSLKEIRKRIRETGLTGRFAVQRAYANWSDPRLGILRNEINELGIDPVQVFGFSRDAKRNAADIQLAIDAIDLAHLRPTITHFVIVSGDGGFASLAKKLHEYGRTVIGVAYRKAANQTLRAVCDEFLWIESGDDEEDSPKLAAPKPSLAVQAQTPAPNSAAGLESILSKVPKPGSNVDRAGILTAASQILHAISNTPAYQRMLDQDGIASTVLGQALHYRIQDLDYTKLGFPKLTDLLRYLSTGKNWQVARRNGGDSSTHLIRRNRVASSGSWESLPDLEEKDLHSVTHYRNILVYGSPSIRFDDLPSLRLLLSHLEQQPPSEISLADLVERATGATQGMVPAEKVRQGLIGLVSAGAFERTPELVPLAEQKLKLSASLRTAEQVLERIRTVSKEKILRYLGRVEEPVLSSLFGENVP
jgi:uncharacterized LabA/DUF88 family protein